MRLTLSCNFLSKIPEFLYKFQYLDLSNNLISEIPSIILESDTLQMLILTDNQIRNISEKIFNISNFSISENPLEICNFSIKKLVRATKRSTKFIENLIYELVGEGSLDGTLEGDIFKFTNDPEDIIRVLADRVKIFL